MAEPSNKFGKMTKEDIEVIYVYTKKQVDTSDINIGIYIILSLIAVIGIIVGIIIVKNNKKYKV